MTLTSHFLDTQLIKDTSDDCFMDVILPHATHGGFSVTHRKESDMRNNHEAKRRQASEFVAHAVLLLQGLSIIVFYLPL